MTNSVSRSRSMVNAHENSDTEGGGLFWLRLRRTAGASAMNSAQESSDCCGSLTCLRTTAAEIARGLAVTIRRRATHGRHG